MSPADWPVGPAEWCAGEKGPVVPVSHVRREPPGTWFFIDRRVLPKMLLGSGDPEMGTA